MALVECRPPKLHWNWKARVLRLGGYGRIQRVFSCRDVKNFTSSFSHREVFAPWQWRAKDIYSLKVMHRKTCDPLKCRTSSERDSRKGQKGTNKPAMRNRQCGFYLVRVLSHHFLIMILWALLPSCSNAQKSQKHPARIAGGCKKINRIRQCGYASYKTFNIFDIDSWL